MIKAKRDKFRFIFAFSTTAMCIFELTACDLLHKQPSLSSIKTCETLNSQGACQDDLSTFENKKQKLFVSANLEHAPKSSSVEVKWKYFSGNQEIPLTTETVEVKEPNNFVTSSLSSPTQGFPAGKYTVILTLPKAKDTKPYVKEFTMTP